MVVGKRRGIDDEENADTSLSILLSLAGMEGGRSTKTARCEDRDKLLENLMKATAGHGAGLRAQEDNLSRHATSHV